MSGKKSSKQTSADLSQTTLTALGPTSDSLHSPLATTSNTCDDDSPLPLSSGSIKTNFEGITLIWYDPRVGETADTKLTAEELRDINDCVLMYSDQADCVKYIQSVTNEKIFLITSGKGIISIIPEIEQFKQVDSIFIFCCKVDKYQHLLPKYESIVGIYSERSSLIKAIKQNVELLQRQLDVFSFYSEHEEKATRDLSKEAAQFLWFQLFKDVLLQMPRNSQAKQELINFSRQYYRGNPKERENILEFEQTYKSDKSIYWYTKDSFLYRLVNKALRTEDIGQLHIFRFFISDLSSKLAEIHRTENCGKKITVMLYRGLKVENDQFEKLKQNLGFIISANGFLSTSYSKKVAIEFAKRSTKRPNVVTVLYEIECNLNRTKSIIFADITKSSEFAQEQEVLFDVGSTFTIEAISEDEQLKMVLVKLTATDAGVKMAEKYIELNRKMNEETTADILFGTLLIQMGKYDQSLNYFTNLLTTSNGKADVARIYSAIGSAYLCKGELSKADKRANRAYQMMIRTKPSRIKDSTRPATVMAHIYLRQEMYEEALDLYFEALEIHEKFYGKKHLDTAVTLNHIGNVFYQMKDYSGALGFYERSFEVREKQLPHVHLDIAASLNNLGLVHWKGGENPDRHERLYKFKAVKYFEDSLDIRKQVLPLDHNDIMQSLDNIIQLHYEMNNIDGAFKYFAEVLTIQKADFDPNDRANLLSRLKEKLESVTDMKLGMGVSWTKYAERTFDSRSVIPHRNDKEARSLEPEQKQIELRQKEDPPVLENLIKVLESDGDYSMALKAVTKILKTSQKFIYFPEYDHNKYLMSYLYESILYAHDSTDESLDPLRQRRIRRHQIFAAEGVAKDEGVGKMLSTKTVFGEEQHNPDESNKACRFYEKLQCILESAISKWANTDNIQIICLNRIGHINQLNGNYKSAVDSLEKSVQLRQSSSIPYDLEDTLADIGLIHMVLGNYSLALASFKKALKLLQKSSYAKDRRIRLISKRIEQTKEALRSENDS